MQNVTEHKIMHMLFESYLEILIKRCERARQEGEELVTMAKLLTKPAQTEKFSPVNANKENLKLCTRKVAVQMIDNLIQSSMVVDDEIVVSLQKDGEQIRTIVELNSLDEEADIGLS